MARADVIRHQLLLPGTLGDRLEALAHGPSTSKSGIRAEAVGTLIGRRADAFRKQFALARFTLVPEDGR